jgi:hypothetical protein
MVELFFPASLIRIAAVEAVVADHKADSFQSPMLRLLMDDGVPPV